MSGAAQAREHKDKAAALLVKGKLAPALDELRRAISAQPNDLPTRRKIADLLARLGRVQEAIAEYQHLAGRYASDGHLLEAIAIGKVILRLEPKHQGTQAALAQFGSRRAQKDDWQARLPLSMTGLIEPDRLREVRVEPGAGSTPAPLFDVGITPAAPTPLFSEIPREVMVELLQRLELRSAAPGEAIVVEGEEGAAMFILVSGSARVVRQSGSAAATAVDKLGEGEIFGEIALLAAVPRVASVIAEDECLLLEISRELLAELSARHPALGPVLQRFYKQHLLANLLRSNELFRAFDRDALVRLVDRFVVRGAARGEELLTQGKPGDGLTVLLRGCCVAYDVPSGQEYPELHEGAVFGEISLLEDCGATATVRTETACVLLFLDRAAVEEELLMSPSASQRLAAMAAQRLERSQHVVAGNEIPLPALV